MIIIFFHFSEQDGESHDDSEIDETYDRAEDELKDYVTPEQLCEKMITLSALPDSKWMNLVNLDLIRVSVWVH